MSVFQAAMPTGTYPNMGAGYLAKTVTVSTGNDSAQYGWWRFASIPFSTLTQILETSSYSAILLVNSIIPAGIEGISAIQSGLIELELRLIGGRPANINENDVMKVLCGGLSPDLFCCTVSDTEIEFYVFINGSFNKRNFTMLNEAYYNVEHVDALEFEATFVSSSAPTGAVYATVRNNASADADGNVISTTYAKQTGTYPNLGAGYLAKRNRIQTPDVQQGWLKIGTVPMSSVITWQEYSCIMIINGVFRSSAVSDAAPKSGFIEIEARKYSTTIGNARIGVLAGDIPTNWLCYVIEDNLEMSIYIYNNHIENIDITFEILSEELSNQSPANIFEFSTSTTALASAPEGAVYAMVRNNASADANGNSFDTNYLWHNNGQEQINMLKDGTTSLDFNDYIEEGKYELQGNADSTAVNFPISSSNGSANNCDWYLRVFVRASVSDVTQVAYSVRADGAIAIRVLSNGTWGNWRLLFDNGVAQQIPAASQTVLGGVKVYKDSEGYFCIDTQ